MMGSGKTTTGDLLAKKLGYNFIDTDVVIEKLVGSSIKQIFEKEGEEEFRKIETEVLKSIGERYSLVVATGGGIVLKPENWGILHQGIVVWLNPQNNILLKRLKSEILKRPLLDKINYQENISNLIIEREPFYQEADLRIIINNESPEEVAEIVLGKLPSILTNPEDSNALQTTAK